MCTTAVVHVLTGWIINRLTAPFQNMRPLLISVGEVFGNMNMRNLKKFWNNQDGDVKMIGAVVGILVTMIVAILVFYNIAGSIDVTDIDSGFTGTPAANATDAVMTQAETFWSVAPIIAIVIVAVVILGYVSRIGGA